MRSPTYWLCRNSRAYGCYCVARSNFSILRQKTYLTANRDIKRLQLWLRFGNGQMTVSKFKTRRYVIPWSSRVRIILLFLEARGETSKYFNRLYTRNDLYLDRFSVFGRLRNTFRTRVIKTENAAVTACFVIVIRLRTNSSRTFISRNGRTNWIAITTGRPFR